MPLAANPTKVRLQGFKLDQLSATHVVLFSVDTCARPWTTSAPPAASPTNVGWRRVRDYVLTFDDCLPHTQVALFGRSVYRHCARAPLYVARYVAGRLPPCLPPGEMCSVQLLAVVRLRLSTDWLLAAGRLDSFFTIKPGAPGAKRKEPATKGKGAAKPANNAKKGGVRGGVGKKK